jgi:hypothetical protein
MKKPRVEDFNPDAKVPELSSPLEGMPPIQKPIPKKLVPSPVRPKPAGAVDSQSPSGSTSARPYGPTPVRRTITRYAFEFFQDQIENLRRFSLEEKARGEKGSMSQMVREAVDAYIARRNRIDQ